MVDGDFDADYVDMTGCPHVPKVPQLDELPVAEQPDMMTKAAMDFCLADAFHPGCEMTWPMRTSGMYIAPFRLKHAPKTPPANTVYYGAVINSDVLPLARGPLLGGQVAGGITRWMAVPWQTDTASCRDGYTPKYNAYLPTFWPARVPNNVLDEKRYAQSVDTNLDEETRKQAFAFRSAWLDNLPLDGQDPNYTNQINSMIKYFDKLAVVQQKKGVEGDPNFPKEMQVALRPTEEQNKVLLETTLHKLRGLVQQEGFNAGETHLLQATVENLGQKHLLNEQELLRSTQDQLKELLATDLVEDHKLTPEIKKIVALLATKHIKLHLLEAYNIRATKKKWVYLKK